MRCVESNVFVAKASSKTTVCLCVAQANILGGQTVAALGTCGAGVVAVAGAAVTLLGNTAVVAPSLNSDAGKGTDEAGCAVVVGKQVLGAVGKVGV